MAGMLFTLKLMYYNGHERVILVCLLDIARYVRQLLCSVKRHPVMALYRIDVNIDHYVLHFFLSSLKTLIAVITRL
jgi:hypothetical protein